jgi:hypothetical protein
MDQNIQIYVDNIEGRNSHSGKRDAPVDTAEKAFSLLPPSWTGRAELIFAMTGRPYEILTDAVCFGTPIGPKASPLVIRGGYEDLLAITASDSSNGDIVPTTADQPADALIGAVLTRMSGTGSPVGTAISIRGNTSGPASNILLQQTIGKIGAGDRFTVQRPAVTLRPTQTLNLTSHDGRSPNLTLVGIKVAPAEGSSLNLLNVRAQCDTCEFAFERAGAMVHTNARIHGGIEIEALSPGLDPKRAQAGVYIHSNAATNIIAAVRNGIFGGHLTFKDITVRVSQGGVLVPHSLEALRAPIHILTGGSALGQPNLRTGQFGWGTATNKARIRNVAGLTGDGLRIFNGGTLNSPAGAIHLDIFGCGRDGVRLDMGSTASFGPPDGDAGLVTSGPPNAQFGMNVRNASRALIGKDAADAKLKGGDRDGYGDVTVDDKRPARQWSEVTLTPLSNPGMSLVRVNT